MKIKLITLAVAAAILAIFSITWSTHALRTTSPDEIKARANAENYNQQAAKQIDAAKMYDQTENFQSNAAALRSTADSTLQLAKLENDREAKLKSQRLDFFNPIRFLGFLLALIAPIFLIVAWFIPTPRPN